MQQAQNIDNDDSFSPASDRHHSWLIQGMTTAGNRFRPSDWVERICSLMAGFDKGRLHYSDMLHPVLVNGVKCVHVDSRLEQQSPEIHKQVMYFAKSNGLNIIEGL
ncbi:MAG: DUF3579 domain-containing protein [Gammaproteobacteria bacterium]|nr:DUF3579 domain-containing protein [Gammaproteobacteria bacterium]